MALISQAIINGQLGSPYGYTNNPKMNTRRGDVFNIISQNRSFINKTNQPFRIRKPNDYLFTGMNKAYSESELKYKVGRLEKAIQNGSVYYFDTETLGQPTSVFKNIIDNTNIPENEKAALIELNSKNHIMTELFMRKQSYQNGVPVGNGSTAIKITNGMDAEALQNFEQKIRDSKYGGLFQFNLERIAGLGVDGAYVPGEKYPRFFDTNANIDDKNLVSRGINNISKNSMFMVGTNEYREEAQRVYDMMGKIAMDENAVFVSLNGDDFDMAVLDEYWNKAGVKRNKKIDAAIKNSHFDEQKAIAQTSKDVIYNDIAITRNKLKSQFEAAYRKGDYELGAKLEDQYNSIVKNDLRITNESIGIAATARGFELPETSFHVAEDDTIFMQGSLEKYHGIIINKVKNSKDSIDKYDDKLFTANAAVMFDKDHDIFFSNTIGNGGNVYNSVGMERGHTYKFNLYDLEDFKINGDTDEQTKRLAKEAKKLKGKKLLEMEDQYEYSDGIKRKSYLVLNNENEMQEKIMNAGNVDIHDVTSYSKDEIKKSTEQAMQDKARRLKDSWYSINSNKGYESFKSNFDTMTRFKELYPNATKEDFLKIINSGDTKLRKEFANLYTKGNYNNSLIQERVMDFYNVFDDLNENYEMYKTLNKAVEDNIGTIDDFKTRIKAGQGIADEIIKEQYNQARTATLYEAKHNLDNLLVQNVSDKDAIKMYYDANLDVEKNVKLNKALASGEKSDVVMAREFENIFGFEFDKNLDVVRDTILGYKPMQENATTLSQIDIISPVDGSYTRIAGDNKNNIEKGIVNKLNSITSANGSKEARMMRRNVYINNVAFDLTSRGLMTKQQLIDFRQSSNPYSKATVLAGIIHDTRKQADNILNKIATTTGGSFGEIVSQGNFDYKNPAASSAETRFLKNYLEQMHKSKVMISDTVEKIGNKTKGELVKTVIKSNEAINKLGQNSVLPTIFSGGYVSDSQVAQLKNMFFNEYGWNESKTDAFLNATIFNSVNSDFKDGISNMIIKSNNQGYLITTNKKRQKRVMDYLIKNKDDIDIDEIKKNAMVYKLDKIETVNGVKAIRQSNSSAVALTNDVVARKISKNESITFELKDTFDEALSSLKYKYKNAIGAMEYGNYEKANSLINSSRMVINESKRLNGVVTTAIRDNNGNIINKAKDIRYSIADYMLGEKYNISELMGSLDTVLKNKELSDSLVKYAGKSELSKLEKSIKRYQLDPFNKANKVLFENQSVGVKMWFGQNSSKIADILLKDERMQDDGIRNMLQKIKENGVGVMLSKESREASRGYINLIPTHEYVAGSLYSGASRPLINQVLSSKAIVEQDMVDAAKRYGIYNGNIEGLKNTLDFNTSRSFITKNALEIERKARSAGDLLSLSTSMKYMSPEEFLSQVNKIQSNSDGIASKLAKDFNVSINDVIKAAEDIGASSSIYEDSGAISPKLARLFEDKTVMVEKDLEDVDSFINQLKNEGKEIIGVDRDLKSVTYKNNSNYFDLKLAIGGSEKMVVHTPQINNEQLDLYEAVFKKISGGANIIGDPNYGKHEAFNSMITMYTNAITRSITNDEDMRIANEILKKNFTVDGTVVHDYQIIRDKVNGYLLQEGTRLHDKKINALEAFQKSINDIKSLNSQFGKNFSKMVNDIEHNGFGYVDIATMSDNTIEKSFRWKDGKRVGGAKINHRSQQVLGLFIGNDPADELKKYRQTLNGNMTNPLQAIINADINEMLNDSEHILKMQQASNVGAALSLNSHFDDELVKKAKIKTLDIDKDIVLTSSVLSADEVPELFAFKGEGRRVNAYKINLGNINLKNPYYTDIEKHASDYAHEIGLTNAVKEDEILRRFKLKFGISETVNEIYVPSLLPHSVGNDYVLSETQKSAADLITAVKQLSSGDHLGKSREELLETANNALASYMDALRYDLTDKNGLFKKNMSIRAENSARLKVANVIAPLTDDKGRYINPLLRDKATKVMPNGEIKYVGAQFVNPETLFGTSENIKASYRNIGRQVLNNEIGNAEEVAVFLKNNSNLKNDVSALGKKYLEDVGIENIIMRDPAMLTTSYQPVKTYIRDSVTAGTTLFDAVTAAYVNGDGDGDEINVFNHILRANKNGGYEILDRNSDIYKALDNAIEVNSKSHFDKLQQLSKEIMDKEFKENRKKAKTIQGYIDKIKTIQTEMFENGDINYVYGETSINNLLSRFLKDSIGQVSNPNYYLKSASAFYHGNMGLTDASLRSQRNIQILADITEQSLIDIKSVKGIEQANAIAKLASNYKENMDILGTKAGSIQKNIRYNKNQVNAMSEMLEQVGGLLENKSSNLIGTNKKIIKFDRNILSDDAARTEMAERILKGNFERGYKGDMNFVSVEEIFGDMFKVLQDDNANSVFWHSSIRQTDISKLSNEYISEMTRAKRALEAVGIGNNSYTNQIFKANGADKFLLNAPMIDNIILSAGDRIQSSSVNNNIDPGLYTVKSISRESNMARIQLEDMTGLVENDKPVIREITGKDFDEISRKLSPFKLSDKYKTNKEIFEYLEPKMSKSFFDDATSSIHNLNKFFGRDNSEGTVANKIANRVKNSINYDNTLDFLATVEVIKKNNLATSEELANMRRSMNEAIMNKGTKNYRDTKKAEILKLKSVSSRGVSSGTYNAFMNDVFNEKVMKDTIDNYKYNYAKDILKNNSRYNIDSIANTINSDLEYLIKESPELADGINSKYREVVDTFKIKDYESLNNIKSLIEESNFDDKMKNEVFNINLKAGIDAINRGENQKAFDMLGKTVITYGDYAGYTIEQLGIDKAKEILSDSYMSNIGKGIDEKIIQETKDIIKKTAELSEKGDIIKVNPNDIAKNNIISEFGDDYLSNIRKQLNENIKKKGKSKIRESVAEKTSSLKSALDKAKTGFDKLSGSKKAAIIAGVTVTSLLGMAAINNSGKKTLYENEDKYDSKGNIKNVKTTENGTTSTRHEVPKSDSRFYASQNVGLGVKVKADAPAGASPKHSGNILSAMFGGSDMNITTSFNDSTTPVNDSDIDEMMSNSTGY